MKTIIHRLFPLALAVLVVASCAPPAVGGRQTDGPASDPSELSGRLLFVRDAALWTLTLPAGQPTQVVPAPGQGMVISARWSPNGSQIALARMELRDRVPASEVVVAGADGSALRQVVGAHETGRYYQLPTWGSDTQRLYVLHTAFSGTVQARHIERVRPGHRGG